MKIPSDHMAVTLEISLEMSQYLFYTDYIATNAHVNITTMM